MTAFWESWPLLLKKKVLPPEEISSFSKQLKANKERIVSLNGAFDLLHRGHLKMLSEASDQKGEKGILIVGLNTDSSIQRYKSPTRPFFPLEHRLQMLASILFVDYVTWFDELDPRSLLRQLSPDIHVNGAEYGQECIEKEVVESQGGKIHIVQLLEGFSTTGVIKKIKESLE